MKSQGILKRILSGNPDNMNTGNMPRFICIVVEGRFPCEKQAFGRGVMI